MHGQTAGGRGRLGGVRGHRWRRRFLAAERHRPRRPKSCGDFIGRRDRGVLSGWRIVGASCALVGAAGATVNAAETTRAAAEATPTAAKTTRAALETTRAAPETTRAAPETTRAAPETTCAAPETTRAAHETTRAAHETTRAAAGALVLAAGAGVSTSPTPAGAAGRRVFRWGSDNRYRCRLTMGGAPQGAAGGRGPLPAE